jgi:hypothetical protein
LVRRRRKRKRKRKRKRSSSTDLKALRYAVINTPLLPCPS